MNKSIYLFFLLLLLYFLTIFFTHRSVLTYQYSADLTAQYWLSQDIPYEVAGKRIFLSDDQIHQAVGFLYWQGYDPSVLNFQHPPLIKYLFGLGIIILGNPLLIQLIFGSLLILITFDLGLKVFKSAKLSFLAALLLIFDPLFIDLSTKALLDLGQAVLIVSYVLFMIDINLLYLFTKI